MIGSYRVVTAVAFTTLALSACGGDDGTSPLDGGTDAATTIEVGLVDYSFEGLPDSVDAGTTLTIANRSDAELHELVAFRLPDGEERPLSELVTLPPDEMIGALGGEPVAVLLQPPGGPVVPAVGDGTLGEAGRYALLCFIPTGAVPQEYLDAAAESDDGPPTGVAGGPPHFTNGMFAELTVSDG